MKKLTFVLFALLLNNFIFAQVLIPRDSLVSDFNYLIKTLEASHPDPYSAFGNKIEFHRKAQLIRENLPKEGMLQFDFYNRISTFISSINDGHTSIYQPENITDDTVNYSLPVKFKIAHDFIYISSAAKEYESLSGGKILSIENIGIDSLIKSINIIRPSENLYGSYLNLVKILSQRRTIKHLFPNLQNQISILIELPDGKKSSTKFDYYTDDNLKQKTWKNFANFCNLTPDDKLIDSKFIDKQNKIAYIGWYNSITSREVVEMVKKRSPSYLNVNLNSVYNALNRKRPADNNAAIQEIPSLFETFSTVLNKMKENNSTHLIIDLRYNPGGYTPITIPILYMLFGDKYFEFNPEIEYNRLISELYLKKFNMTLQQFNKNRQSNYQLGDYQFSGFFEQDTTISVIERRNNFLNNQRDQGFSTFNCIENLNGKSIYSPKIIVLTSPTTFSASYHFVWFLSQIGNTKIIGVPSSQAGNTFMETTPFELSKTHLKGSISNAVQVFYPNDDQKGKILTPDFPMNWELFKKYSFDNNAEIMYLLDLIDNKQI